MNERSGEEEMYVEAVSGSRIHQWGSAAFVLGNLLFMANKLDEMSRLFLGRWMPDVISGQNPVLILLGQALLIIGYVACYRFYSQRVGRWAKDALPLAQWRRYRAGGWASRGLCLILQVSVSRPGLGRCFCLCSLGCSASRRPDLVGISIYAAGSGPLGLAPLATGLIGLIGVGLFKWPQITATFLFFRTLFSLGLVESGVILWLEDPVQPGGR